MQEVLLSIIGAIFILVATGLGMVGVLIIKDALFG